MIPTPLAFEEVAQEAGFAQATHLGHTEFGKAPERFNTVHVIFPTKRTHFHDDESDDGGNHRGPGHRKISSRPCGPCY